MVVINKNKHMRITRHRTRSRGVHVSSIVIEVIKDILKPLYFFFTRKFHTHKKQKIHTSEQKQKKNKIFMCVKTSKRKKFACFKLPLITSFTILLVGTLK